MEERKSATNSIKGALKVKLESIRNNARASPTLRGGYNLVLPSISAKKRPAADNRDRDQTDKNDTPTLKELLRGTYEKLPHKRPTEVRIFLSSTFSDMSVERNILSKEVYPKLREFCNKEHGLDFSVVDMRWGVTDDASIDHSPVELCLGEVANCQQVGLGPTFVVMLGDRYGNRHIPKYILQPEYDIILQKITSQDDRELVEKWYKKDLNAVPPHYKLQSIDTHISDYGQNIESNAEWNRTLSKLTSVVRKAVDEANKKQEISDERKHAYHVSVTELEIEKGLLQQSDRKHHCLCFMRSFTGLNNAALNEKNSKAPRYIECELKDTEFTLDIEVEDLRRKLKEKIASKLDSSRLFKYPPQKWLPQGMNLIQHKEYFDRFCINSLGCVKELVNAEIRKQDKMSLKMRIQYDEILHHLHLCHSKCELFAGREQVLKSVKYYLDDKSNSKPLVLYSESGGGKSYIMAKVFDLLPTWYGKKICRVIRFLGTSPLSSDIFYMLKSVLKQIAASYSVILQPDNYKNIQSLFRFFPRIIRTIARATNDKIVIVLDSIDQLSSNNDAHKMKWLPVDLPANVHIIISTLPDVSDILSNCRNIQLSSSNMIELKPEHHQTSGEQIINAYLKRESRTLQNEQKELILNAFDKLPNMLYLKLLMDKAVTWPSDASMHLLKEGIADSTQAAINQLFSKLEIKYGQILVCHTLGYITADVNGLTAVEIEDALSCDNEVLNQVYQYHPPPNESIIRIPALLWARIHNELKEYLVERNSYEKSTLYWYHRQFIETANSRYLNGDIGKKLHLNLAELFLAENGMKKDVVLSRLRNPKTIIGADRQIRKQPINKENIRALVAIPYHLTESGHANRLMNDCFFRLKYLLAKIQAQGVYVVIKDIKQAFGDLNTDTVTDIRCLVMCLQNITERRENPSLLANEFLLHLPHYEEITFCYSLVQQAKQYLAETKRIQMIPLHGILWKQKDLSEAETRNCDGPKCETESINFFQKAHVATIVNSSDNQYLLTFQCGNYKQWSLENLHCTKTISYGDKFIDFYPENVRYNQYFCSSLCLIYNRQKGFIVDLDKNTVKAIDVDDSILATAQGSEGFFILMKSTEKKLRLLIVDYNSNATVKSSIDVEEILESEQVEIILTLNEKFLALKVLCSEEEVESILKSLKKVSSVLSLNARSKFRFYGLDLSKDKGNLIPCCRRSTGLPHVGNDFASHEDNRVLLGVGLQVFMWDVSSGRVYSQLLKSSKQRIFNQVVTDTNTAESMECIATNHNKEECTVVATGSSDGWFHIFRENGENIAENMDRTVPNHNAMVKHVIISPDSRWVATVTSTNLVRFWAVQEKCTNYFAEVQLDADFKQAAIDHTGQYIVITGQIPNQGTKISLMNIIV